MKRFKQYIQEDIPFDVFSSNKSVKKGIRKTHRKAIGQNKFAIELEFQTPEGRIESERDDLRDMLMDQISPHDVHSQYESPEEFAELLEAEVETLDYEIKQLESSIEYDKADKDEYELGYVQELYGMKAQRAVFEVMKDYIYDLGEDEDGEINSLEDKYPRDISTFFSVLAAKQYIQMKNDEIFGTKEWISDKKKFLQAKYDKYPHEDEFKAKGAAAKKKLDSMMAKIRVMKKEWLKIDIEDYRHTEGMKIFPENRVTDKIGFNAYSSKTNKNLPKYLAQYAAHYSVKGNEEWHNQPLFKEIFPVNRDARNVEEVMIKINPTWGDRNDFSLRLSSTERPTILLYKLRIVDGFMDQPYVRYGTWGTFKQWMRDGNNAVPRLNGLRKNDLDKKLLDKYEKELNDLVMDVIGDYKFLKDGKVHTTFFESDNRNFELVVTDYENKEVHIGSEYKNQNVKLGDIFYIEDRGLLDLPVYELSVTMSLYDSKGRPRGGNIHIDPVVAPLFVIKGNGRNKMTYSSDDLNDIFDHMSIIYYEKKQKEGDVSIGGTLSLDGILERIESSVIDRTQEFWDEHIDGLKNYYYWNYDGGMEEYIESIVNSHIDDGGDASGLISEYQDIMDMNCILQWEVEDDYGKIEIKTDDTWTWKDAGDLYSDLEYMRDNPRVFVPCGGCSCHVHMDNTLGDNLFGAMALGLMFDEKAFTNDPRVIGPSRPEYTVSWAREIRPGLISKLEYEYFKERSSESMDGKKSIIVSDRNFRAAAFFGGSGYPGIRPSSRTLEFRYPSSELISNPSQILENIFYFASMIEIASTKKVIRKQIGSNKYLVAVKNSPDGESYRLQILNSPRYDRSLLDAEMLKDLRKYG